MLTRITDRKIPCVYIHVYRITKNWGPGPYNSLRHADNRRYFSGLSLTRNRREAHVLLGEGSGKIWTCSCWEKGNFIMINEFKYGQTWKIWPSPLFNYFTIPLRWNKHSSLLLKGYHWSKIFFCFFGKWEPDFNTQALSLFACDCCPLCPSSAIWHKTANTLVLLIFWDVTNNPTASIN